ncbi:MAG TPA: hypothetical protein VK869_16175 [Rubrobacteraceae bacterium]|nr:hypothetical protein [Rubrobacteraceae bacterium]
MTDSAGAPDQGVTWVSRLAAARIPWLLCAVSVSLAALAILLLVFNLSYPGTPVFEPWLDNALTAISYAPVGALIASRHPENPVGWLLCLYGLVAASGFFGAEYAIHALLAHPGSLPAGEAVAWMLSWLLPLGGGLAVLYVVLFPTGRLPSRRWRPLVWATVAFMVVGSILAAFAAGSLMGVLGPIENPLGTEGLAGPYRLLFFGMTLALTGAAVLAVLVRLRRSRGVERQQVKWFAYAAAAYFVASSLAYMVPRVFDTPAWFDRVGFALNVAFVPAIPVAIGIAILRYRLYDIDLIINRTLVYGSLTAVLGGLYFVTIVVFQGMASVALQAPFVALTGQKSTLATVLATLAVAALFNPLRRRIQSFIDRRFYRRRYDARKTLEAFSHKLRDETDLARLGDDLTGVVGETMQPAHVSLWLRPDPAPRGSRVRV